MTFEQWWKQNRTKILSEWLKPEMASQLGQHEAPPPFDETIARAAFTAGYRTMMAEVIMEIGPIVRARWEDQQTGDADRIDEFVSRITEAWESLGDEQQAKVADSPKERETT